MARMTRDDARDILHRLHIDIGADYHILPSCTVDRIIEEADRYKYRKPTNANGSRARYFHAYLQRIAARKEG